MSDSPLQPINRPGPYRVLFRLGAAATIIGFIAIGILISIGAALGGIFSEFSTLVPKDAFVKVPIIASGFTTVWIACSVWLYEPIRKALSLESSELALNENLARKAYRKAYLLPYHVAWVSFVLWLLGGSFGAFVLLVDLHWAIRWVAPASLTLMGVGINLPQVYMHRRILAPVTDYLRAGVPALQQGLLPLRRTIAQKLTMGFAGSLLFALGMTFIANYVHIERARSKDRIAELHHAAGILVELLSQARVSDFSEWEQRQFLDLLSGVRVGEQGGVVVIDRDSGEVILNVPKLTIDERTRKAIESGTGEFGEDYKRGVTFVTIDSAIIPDIRLSHSYWIALGAPHSADLRFFTYAAVIVLLLMIGALAMSYLISQELVRPLRVVVRRAAKIADGKLNTDIPVVVDDEVGELAGQTRFMVTNLHRMVTSLRDTFNQLSDAAAEIVGTTAETAEASSEQLAESEHTGRATGNLNHKIAQIVRKMGDLNESIESASSAAFELASTAGQLRETAVQLESETNAIAGSTHTLEESLKIIEQGIARLDEAANATHAAIEKIDGAITEMRAVVGESQELSSDVLERARSGSETVQETLQGINRIREAVDEAAERIHSLGRKNVKIGQILDVINQVADQTNLLSFNAAIIAAQAGEHGHGFAVVADEIRKLAEQTSSSTGEIAALIASIQKETMLAERAIERGSREVVAGTKLAGNAGESLERITARAAESLEHVRRIAAAVEEEARQGAVVIDVVKDLRGAVGDFMRSERDQRRAGETIVGALRAVQEMARRLSRAADEQKRAAEEVSRGISDVQQTMDAVVEGVQQEAQEAETIQQASEHIRRLAEANAAKARELQEVSGRLEHRAEALRAEISRFEL